MYNTTDAVPRIDLSTVLMEAVHQDEQFIGQLVLPVNESEMEYGRYPKFRIASGGLLKKQSQKRNQSGTYNESNISFEWDNYQTEEFGHEERIDDVIRKRMKHFFDAEVITAKDCMRKVMLDYEVTVASTVLDPDTFNVGNPAADYSDANLATMDVPADINAAIEAMNNVGEQPNTLVLSLRLWNLIKRSQKMQTFLYGFLNTTQGGSNISTQIVAEAFNLQQIIIARKTVDLALPGKAPNIQPVWGNDYLFLGDIQGGDFKAGGVGRTMIWDADSEGGLFTTDTYRDEKRRGDIVRVRSNRTEKIINPNAGYLISTTRD
jgi:hypothetical protein